MKGTEADALRPSSQDSEPSSAPFSLVASLASSASKSRTSSRELNAERRPCPLHPVFDESADLGSLCIRLVIFLIGVAIELSSMTQWGQMLAGRLIAGYGVGALSMLAPLYQAEVSLSRATQDHPARLLTTNLSPQSLVLAQAPPRHDHFDLPALRHLRHLLRQRCQLPHARP